MKADVVKNGVRHLKSGARHLKRISAWIIIQALFFSQIVTPFANAQPDALRIEQREDKSGLEELREKFVPYTYTGLEEEPWRVPKEVERLGKIYEELLQERPEGLTPEEIKLLIKTLPAWESQGIVIWAREKKRKDLLDAIGEEFGRQRSSLSHEAQEAYRRVTHPDLVWDPRTLLDLGVPTEQIVPDPEQVDDRALLAQMVEEFLTSVHSQSGIRQVYDPTGDSWGRGTTITLASKEWVMNIASAFTELVRKRSKKEQPKIVVAMDTRHTGPAIAEMAIRTLLAEGIPPENIHLIGVATVMEAVVYARERADGFIFVSASHNPYGQNGVKLGFSDGSLLPPEEAKQFIAGYQKPFQLVKELAQRYSQRREQSVGEFVSSFLEKNRAEYAAFRKATSALMGRVRRAQPAEIRRVFTQVARREEDATRIYDDFSDQVMTSIYPGVFAVPENLQEGGREGWKSWMEKQFVHYERFSRRTQDPALRADPSVQGRELNAVSIFEDVQQWADRYRANAGALLRERKDQIRSSVHQQNIWIVHDSTGGASNETDFLEGYGFHAVAINDVPRIGMRHHPTPVGRALDQAKEKALEVWRDGKSRGENRQVIFFVRDIDGDRKNVGVVRQDGTVLTPGVQQTAALDTAIVLLSLELARLLHVDPQKGPLAHVIVNDATSALAEQLEYLGIPFRVVRTETGEPVLNSRAAQLQSEGKFVAALSEWSNGGFWKTELLVREPRHTFRTILNALSDPALFIRLLEYVEGRDISTEEFRARYPNGYTLADLFLAVPYERTTSMFEPEGERRSALVNPPAPKALKAAFQEIFGRYWEENRSRLAEGFGIYWEALQERAERNGNGRLSKALREALRAGFDPAAHFDYEVARSDGERITVSQSVPQAPVTQEDLGGLTIRYRMKVPVEQPDGRVDWVWRLVGWQWFRASGTEPGVVRKGASVALAVPRSEGVVAFVDRKQRQLHDDISRLLNEAEALAASRAGLEEPQTVEEAMGRWFQKGATREEELALQRWLVGQGEQAIGEFAEKVRQMLNLSPEAFGAYKVPPFDPEKIPAPGQMSGTYPIPSSVEEFEAERLRLMAHVALRRAFGHLRGRPIKIVSNVGIGFVGGAVITVTADAGRYAVVAYQRPSAASSKKVNLVNEGKMPVQTSDSTAQPRLEAAVRRGDLTATFLMESLATADLIMVETELHFRKYYPKAIDHGESTPEASLELLRRIGAVMQPEATVLIESTVPPGFTEKEARPALTAALEKRGMSGQANLAYAFQRLEPGPSWIRSLLEHKRIGAALTAKAREDLEEYFRSVGFRSWEIWSDVAAVEALKDIENAYSVGSLEVVGGYLRGVERIGGNAWPLFAEIAADRPETHGQIGRVPAIQEGQGYCTPKELGEFIAGLKRNFSVSDLAIKQMFQSRIDAVAISDHRAQDYAYWLMGELDDLGLTLADARVLVAGASYKPGVGDTRWTGSERLIRLLAHYGAWVEATDPYVADWKEFRRQRLLDPEGWAYSLHNQERLKDLKLTTARTLYEALHPKLHAIVLATRHWQYVGHHQLAFLRSLDPRHPLHRQWQRMFEGLDSLDPREEGLDPVKVAARMMGLKGRIVIDTFNFLSDQDIKEFLALGWRVLGSGKGHIPRLAQEITPQEKLVLHRRLLEELQLLKGGAGVVEEDRQLAIRVAQAEIRALEAEAVNQKTGLEESPELLRTRASLERSLQQLQYAPDHQKALHQAAAELYRATIRYLETVEGIDRHGDIGHLRDILDAAKAKLQRAAEGQHDRVLRELTRHVVVPTISEAKSTLGLAGQELTAFAAVDFTHLQPPFSGREAAEIVQSLRGLADRVDGLRLFIDAAVEELLTPEGKQKFWRILSQLRLRPELAIPAPRTDLGGRVLMPDTIPLFPGTYPVGNEASGPPYYTRAEDHRLHRVARRPWNQTAFNSLTLKMVPDMAKDPSSVPQAWGRFSLEVPLYLAKAAGPNGGSLAEGFEAYPGAFDQLPHEFQRWVLQDVVGRGLVPTTMDGEPQAVAGLVMQVNLQKTTPARGRGGLLFDLTTRGPYTFWADGFEWLLDLKALGPYGGGDPTTLDYNENRVVSGGRGAEGTVARSRLGQLLGFQEDWSEINNLFELRGTEAWERGWVPRPVFLLRFQFAGNPNHTLAMVARAVPTNERLGQSHIGKPHEVANRVGWSTAEVLHYPKAAVHIALIADNIMSNGYPTDMGSLVWLHNERDPLGAWKKYGGWSMQIPLIGFQEMKSDRYDELHGEYLMSWVAGFRERFLESRVGKERIQNPRRFLWLLDPKNTRPQDDPNGYIDELLGAIWKYYLPWEILKERLEFGYDPTRESSYTQTSGTIYSPELRPILIMDNQGNEWGIVDAERLAQMEREGSMRIAMRGNGQEREVTAEEFFQETGQTAEDLRTLPERMARKFIRDQRELLEGAWRLIAEEGYPDLGFDFEKAYQILDARESSIQPGQPSYANVYDLRGIYPEKRPSVIPIIANVQQMAAGREPVRTVYTKRRASVMSEKVGVENVVIGRRGRPQASASSQKTGLEEPQSDDLLVPLERALPLDQVRVIPARKPVDFSKGIISVVLLAGRGERVDKSIPEASREKYALRDAQGNIIWEEKDGKEKRIVTLPKVVMPIDGKPAVVRMLQALQTQGPVIAVVGYRQESVRRILDQYTGGTLTYVIQEDPAQGTAAASRLAAAVPEVRQAKRILFFAGDHPLFDLNLLEKFNATWRDRSGKDEPLMLIGTTILDDAGSKGRVLRDRRNRTEDPKGRIIGIIEAKDIDAIEKGEAAIPKAYRDAGYTTAQRLREVREANVSVYAATAQAFFKGLGTLTRDNAQKQYYATDLIRKVAQAGGRVIAVPIPEWQAAGLTRYEDLQEIERTVRSHAHELRWERTGLEEWLHKIYPDAVAEEKREQWREWLALAAKVLDPKRSTTVSWSGGRVAWPFGGRHVDYIGWMDGSLGSPIVEGIGLFIQEADGLNGAVEVYGLGSPAPEVMAAYPHGRPRTFSLNAPWMSPPDDGGDRITDLAKWDAWAGSVKEARFADSGRMRTGDTAIDGKANHADDLIAGVIAFLKTPFGDPSGKARQTFERLAAQGKGLRIAVVGDLPPGGQSTSSAIVMALTQGLNHRYGWGMDSGQIIHVGYAERVWAGTQGGIKDHATFILPAGFLGVSPIRMMAALDLPSHAKLVSFDTGVSRDDAVRLSPKMQRPGNSEQEIKGRTGIGYALSVLWLRRHHPELVPGLRPDEDRANPYGFGRELFPGGAADLTPARLLELVLEMPDSITRDELYAALPGFQSELRALFDKEPSLAAGAERAPYRLRQMFLFGLTEGARSRVAAQVLQAMKEGNLSEEEAFDKLMEIAKAAHNGDRVTRYRMTLRGEDGEPKVEAIHEEGWGPEKDELLEGQISRGEDFTLEDLALGKAGFGNLERSVEPIDLMVDLIEAFNQFYGGHVTAGVVVGAGLGGTVTALVRAGHVDRLERFLQREYYPRLGLPLKPALVVQQGRPAQVLEFPQLTSGLEEAMALPAGADKRGVIVGPGMWRHVGSALAFLKTQPGEQIPVAVITANDAEETVVEAGLEEFGIKPIAPVVNLARSGTTLGDEIVRLQMDGFWSQNREVFVVLDLAGLEELGPFLHIPDASFRIWKEWVGLGEAGTQA